MCELFGLSCNEKDEVLVVSGGKSLVRERKLYNKEIKKFHGQR